VSSLFIEKRDSVTMSKDENVGIAFALVIGAGLSTALGAAVVFFPSLVHYASRKTLAAGLGFSAGVMMNVSFIEIFQKSIGAFIDAGHSDSKAFMYANLCFFGGVIIMVLLNHLIHKLLKGMSHDPSRASQRMQSTKQSSQSIVEEDGNRKGEAKEEEEDSDAENEAAKKDCGTGGCPCDKLEEVQGMVRRMEETQSQAETEGAATDEVQTEGASSAKELSRAERKRLMMMSSNTAAAIALHNFPEGLATFVAALNDPAVGAVLAFAIAIHNIPEGLCVAMPVYYATGNRFKAFSWALLSGISEPIAALLGWAILANRFTDTLYGVLFGMVAGMMVIISARELLPTAHRYDPNDSVVTNMFILGMLVMTCSLVLFVA